MGFSLPFIKPFAITDDGEPAAGYQLFFYEVGTTDPKPTYANFALTIPNAHPLILDAAGRFPESVGSSLFLAGGPYKAVLKTPALMGSATVWTVDKFSGTGSDQVLVVLNIADLKALTPNTAEQVLVLGYYTPGDGGGGLILWNSGTSLYDDGIYFKPDDLLVTDAGRWVRSFTGAINLLWYGARGDGVTSDTIPLQSAIDYAINLFPKQTIEITRSPTANAYKFASAPIGLNANGYTLNVLDGVRLDFDFAQAIGCTFNAGPYRIFDDGSAQVTFNTFARLVQGAYPEWWGAIGDGVFDCENALTICFLSTAPSYVLPSFFYLVVGAIVFPPTGTIYSYGKIQDAVFAVQLDYGIYIFTTGAIIQAEHIRGEVEVSGVLVQSDTDVVAGTLPTGGSTKARAGISLLTFPRGIGRLGQDITSVTKVNGPHDFISFLVEKNVLHTLGDTITVKTGGVVEDSNSTKRIELYYGLVQIFDSGLFRSYIGTPNDVHITDWALEVQIICTGINNIKARGVLQLFGTLTTNQAPVGAGGLFQPNIIQTASYAVDLTVLDSFIKMVGTTVAGASLNQNSMLLNFEPAN